MKKKNISLTMILTLIVGIFVSVAIYFAFSVNRISVVTATQSVRSNVKITKDMVTIKKIDKEFLPENYIKAEYADQIIGRYSDIGFTTGSVLTTENVATGKGSRSVTIPKGYTVMNLTLDTIPQGVVAGDHVNILIGTNASNKGKVVLTYQKINVTNVVMDNDKVVTGIEIQVTPEQAQKIEYAQLNGTLSIALLPNDYSSQNLSITDEDEFMNIE